MKRSRGDAGKGPSSLVEKKRPKIATTLFVSALSDMLGKSSGLYNDYITWSTNGENMCVVDPTGFCMHVLPVYFSHKNFFSFVRQLNVYVYLSWNRISEQNFKKSNLITLGHIDVCTASWCYFGVQLFPSGPYYYCKFRY